MFIGLYYLCSYYPSLAGLTEKHVLGNRERQLVLSRGMLKYEENDRLNMALTNSTLKKYLLICAVLCSQPMFLTAMKQIHLANLHHQLTQVATAVISQICSSLKSLFPTDTDQEEDEMGHALEIDHEQMHSESLNRGQEESVMEKICLKGIKPHEDKVSDEKGITLGQLAEYKKIKHATLRQNINNF